MCPVCWVGDVVGGRGVVLPGPVCRTSAATRPNHARFTMHCRGALPDAAGVRDGSGMQDAVGEWNVVTVWAVHVSGVLGIVGSGIW